jgi:hypothetical protein
MSLSEGNIKNKISISQYANKIYIDPFYGIPMSKAAVNYSIFSSKWDIEEVNEDNIEFVKNIYANKTIKQIGTNNHLEKLANRNIKPQKDNYLNSVLKRIINNFKTSESIN